MIHNDLDDVYDLYIMIYMIFYDLSEVCDACSANMANGSEDRSAIPLPNSSLALSCVSTIHLSTSAKGYSKVL